jgi:hypothetical protein
MRLAAGALAALAIALALTACGGSQDTTRRRLATYLASVDRIERQLATPLGTIDTVDRRLTAASSGAGTKSGSTRAPQPTAPQEQRSLHRAAAQITVVAGRLRALAAPAPAAHLKTLLVTLAERQAALAVQTERLVSFAPGFSRSLRPLGPAVTALEKVLSINQANGTAAVQQVYLQKAAALRRFAGTLQLILTDLGRLTPPSSSQPTYAAERRSLTRMRAAASALAGDLSSGHTSGVAGVLRSFDQAAALPASRAAQEAERGAVRAYDRQVDDLTTLVAQANRERLALAKRYP